MSEPIEPGKVMPTYSGFVILRMNEIWNLWRDGDPLSALTLAVRFADTMVIKKIKEKMKADVKYVREELRRVSKVSGVDFFTTHLVRNREAQNVARRLLIPFMSKLSDLLDEWGYYEVPSRRLKSSDFKELEKNEG